MTRELLRVPNDFESFRKIYQQKSKEVLGVYSRREIVRKRWKYVKSVVERVFNNSSDVRMSFGEPRKVNKDIEIDIFLSTERG